LLEGTATLNWYISSTSVSVLLGLMLVIQSTLFLGINLIIKTECLTSFLGTNNFRVVHIDLINTIVNFSTVQLRVDMFTEFIILDGVTGLVSADKCIQFVINRNLVIRKCRLELIDVGLAA